MSPRTFTILCVCQTAVLALFGAAVLLKVTNDYIGAFMMLLMGSMIGARLWQTRQQPL